MRVTHCRQTPHSPLPRRHLGHDPKMPNGTVITSYTKNVWAINEMNSLPTPGWPNSAWPDALGGGPVLAPAGVTVSGDLIDSANTAGDSVNSCNQWANFTTLYGLTGRDGLLKYKTYEGRGNVRGGLCARTPWSRVHTAFVCLPFHPTHHAPAPLPPTLTRSMTAITRACPCRVTARRCLRVPSSHAMPCANRTRLLTSRGRRRRRACTTLGTGQSVSRVRCISST